MLALIAFAIVGGTTMQLAQSSQYAAPGTTADMPCDTMMSMAVAGHGLPMAPGNGMTPDCIKQMGCIIDIALPARLAGHEITVHFSTVDYWTAGSKWAVLIREPEILPLRTA